MFKTNFNKITDKSLQELAKWVEWQAATYIESMNEQEFGIGFNVEHPGFDSNNYWLIFEAHQDGSVEAMVLYSMEDPKPGREWSWDHTVTLTHQELKDYIESLPNPLERTRTLAAKALHENRSTPTTIAWDHDQLTQKEDTE